MPVSSALFLSRLESWELVCTAEEHIGAAFADTLGGETSQAALDMRAQMVDVKPANERKKLNLGPNRFPVPAPPAGHLRDGRWRIRLRRRHRSLPGQGPATVRLQLLAGAG